MQVIARTLTFASAAPRGKYFHHYQFVHVVFYQSSRKIKCEVRDNPHTHLTIPSLAITHWAPTCALLDLRYGKFHPFQALANFLSQSLVLLRLINMWRILRQVFPRSRKKHSSKVLHYWKTMRHIQQKGGLPCPSDVLVAQNRENSFVSSMIRFPLSNT